jgi:hypothetical protein
MIYKWSAIVGLDSQPWNFWLKYELHLYITPFIGRGNAGDFFNTQFVIKADGRFENCIAFQVQSFPTGFHGLIDSWMLT